MMTAMAAFEHLLEESLKLCSGGKDEEEEAENY
jgi:hypothetical protein